jgi:aryl-alcohol dehydrogenase-like predicted oxidoreductase
MPLFAWSSQARGFFSGAFTPESQNELMQRVYFSEDNWERLRRARELGEIRGGYSAIQVALAWVLHQPFPTFPLVGPANVAELNSCVQALELELTPEESAWLNLEA